MAFSVTKSCSLLLILSLLHGTSSQTTQPPDVIGYVVEKGHPTMTVRCGDKGDTVETYTSSPDESKTTEFLSCYQKSRDPCPYPISCGSIKVIESWPDRGSTRGVIDCMPKNISASVSRLYRNKPEDLPKGFTDPIITPTPTTKTRDSDEGGEDEGGPNVKLIVGAVVGSLGGCGLIIGALCLGIRIGRRRSGPSGSIRERLQALPRPFVSIGLKRPPRIVSGQEVTTIQSVINRGPAELDADSNQIPTERVALSGAEGTTTSLGLKQTGVLETVDMNTTSLIGPHASVTRPVMQEAYCDNDITPFETTE